MPWNLTSDRPIFSQIMDIIFQNIISGKYAPGEKLPSVRDLAAQAAVNPNTLEKIQEFLKSMENLGISNEETAVLLTEILEGEK